MRSAVNPFAGDRDREQIWEMLVRRDIEAFVSQDWSLVADDFDEVRFLGIHAHNDRNPDKWDAGFPTLASYRDEWLRQAAESAAVEYAESLAEGIFRATDLSVIDITGDVALARKKFEGTIARKDGSVDRLNWQTLYFCRRDKARWKITGFVGYMAYR
ncbi:hypothetical protein F9K88_07060 [Brucella intermedia]|uniref:Nuclear transport factor 2 family protein n=5 Tax=Brucella/Ochrobactrum group TaxID=2826938 RepID=U4VKE3_9HYPH|nr:MULTISPECIES: hypothetical protein [Brucella/Ochrobactrum group]ERI13451.1 hypothetical protein O206_08260 [Ochrobactrum sp. EGD-AQ16]ERM03281.1 hypothetical protein Q644_12075 [Brucella intermedia 229E]PJT22775.1 hypothetical protein CN884_12450 [Ochrobactrum sp. 30A/1000/2015]PJT37636.1 hypothetical protein CN883_16865 [Ochrobactrum sp. 27A/999/2015]PJT42484.1 hypothetical protein CN882_14865 [Ochrobactrum sp. 23A/997/2015]BBA72929.1 hypothetical protein [Ochrobactrum sp. PW1]